MRSTFTLLLVGLSLTAALAQEPLRQRSNTKGLNVGAALQYAHWNTGDVDLKFLSNGNTGGGLGVRLGYGFNQKIEAYTQIDGAFLTATELPGISTTLVHWDLGARLNLGSTTSRLRPVIDLAYSLIGASVDVKAGNQSLNLFMAGGGLTGGVGLNYFVSLPIAINLRYSRVLAGQFTSIKLEDIPVDGSPTIGTGRLSAGITWYLRGRR